MQAIPLISRFLSVWVTLFLSLSLLEGKDIEPGQSILFPNPQACLVAGKQVVQDWSQSRFREALHRIVADPVEVEKLRTKMFAIEDAVEELGEVEFTSSLGTLRLGEVVLCQGWMVNFEKAYAFVEIRFVREAAGWHYFNIDFEIQASIGRLLEKIPAGYWVLDTSQSIP